MEERATRIASAIILNPFLITLITTPVIPSQQDGFSRQNTKNWAFGKFGARHPAHQDAVFGHGLFSGGLFEALVLGPNVFPYRQEGRLGELEAVVDSDG
jgi:hypothetical protein